MQSDKSGFTIIEILISLVLISALVLVLSNLLVPLSLTRASNIQTQATSFARSYIELVKARWQVRSSFNNGKASLPVASDTSGTADIKLPAGWALKVDGADSWTSIDTIRTLKVTVEPTGTVDTTDLNLKKQWVTLQITISAPS